MLAGVSFLLPWTMGWALTRLLLGRRRWHPAWLRWVMEWSLGWAAGGAISSALYFTLLWAGAPLLLAPALEALILAASLYFARRLQPAAAIETRAGASWVLRAGAAVTLSLFLLSFWRITACAPDGEWDALFIWNVRARFLGGGAESWRVASLDVIDGRPTPVGHPDYPLLTSSLLGRAMWGSSRFDAVVPVIGGLLYSLALAGLLGAAVAWLGSESFGLAAMMTLLSCELFSSWSATQYADIPLALYGLASLALLAAARRLDWPRGMLLLSGLLAGAAPWTKNEGIPLLVCLLATALLVGGVRAVAPMAAGALPLVALTAAFKWALAPASSVLLPATLGGALGNLAQAERWALVGESFLRNLFGISYWWAHPVLLFAGAAAILGFISAEDRRRHWPLLAAPGGLLAVDIGVLLTTRADLAWNLNTAMDRLVLQTLPSLLFLAAITIRPPAPPSPAAAPHPGPKPRKRRKAKSADRP